MRSLVGICASALAACHGVHGLELPEPGKTYLFVFARGEEVLDVFAYDALPPLSGLGWDRAYAVPVSCSLERLGLSAGRQALLEARPDASLLPPNVRVYMTALDEGAWARTDPPPEGVADALARLPVPMGMAPCSRRAAQFSAEPLRMPDDPEASTSYALAIDADTALVGARRASRRGQPDPGHASIYEVNAQRSTVVRRDDLEPQGSPIASMARADDGTLWAITYAGAVLRGSFEEGLQTVSSSAAAPFAPQRDLVIAISRGGAPFELFAAGLRETTFSLSRFDGRTWTRTSSVFVRENRFDRPSLRWVSPGEVVVMTFHLGALRVGSSSVAPLGLPEPPSSFYVHPTLGLLVGTGWGSVFERSDEAWRRLPTPETNAVLAMVQDGTGLLYSTRDEARTRLAQFQPNGIACEAESPLPDTLLTAFVAAGEDRFVALTLENDFGSMGVAILRRTEAASTCVD